MSKLEEYFKRDLRHPEDVRLLKHSIPEIAGLPDFIVQDLYSDYSDELYSAGWMFVDEYRIEEFKFWLK